MLKICALNESSSESESDNEQLQVGAEYIKLWLVGLKSKLSVCLELRRVEFP